MYGRIRLGVGIRFFCYTDYFSSGQSCDLPFVWVIKSGVSFSRVFSDFPVSGMASAVRNTNEEALGWEAYDTMLLVYIWVFIIGPLNRLITLSHVECIPQLFLAISNVPTTSVKIGICRPTKVPRERHGLLKGLSVGSVYLLPLLRTFSYLHFLLYGKEALQATLTDRSDGLMGTFGRNLFLGRFWKCLRGGRFPMGFGE